MTGEVTQQINATPEALWDLVSDVTRMGEWSPETYRAAWVRGATGPAVGARSRGFNRRPFLQRRATTPRVTVADRGREFAFALGILGQQFVVWRYRFEPCDGGTAVTESVAVRGYALYGLLRPRRRERQVVAGMRATLSRLEDVAEADSGAA